MLIKLDTPQVFSRVIDIISELVLEVRIKVNDFGMSLVAMDPANVAMVEFKLPRSAFSQFEAGQEILGVNLDNLKRVLKRAGAGSSLILEKRDNMLNVQIQDRIKRNFTMGLIDIDAEEKKMPDLEYVARVEMNSIDLINAIEDCSVVSDACSFKINEGKFIVESKGLNSAMAEFSGDEARIDAENCKSRYSLEYLQKFIKSAKIIDKTILKFSNDHPLRMEFRTDFIELNFILAPRVETED